MNATPDRLLHKAPFADIGWEAPAPGIRSKTAAHGERKLRLVEFSEGIREEEWRLKEHYGYVIRGALPVNFDGPVVEYAAGAGICIPEGTRHRHEGAVAPGEEIYLFLVEKA